MANRGGRPKGTPNKPKAALEASLKRRFGEDFCVVHKMAEVAMESHKEAMKNGGDKLAKLTAAQGNWAKLAPYLHAQLKAVDVDLTSGGDSLAPTEIVLRVAEGKDDSGNG